MARFKKGDRKPPNSGRKPGVVNKSTALVRDVIEQAAAALGGVERLVAWARESRENERTFWGSIYPKLLPLQVTGPNDGAIKIERIERVIVRTPDSPALGSMAIEAAKKTTIDATAEEVEPAAPANGKQWAN
jgi:hypothetical protein